MSPIRRVLFHAVHWAALFAVLLAGCDGSGGSRSAPDPGPDEPQFDLTGTWRLGEPVDCEFTNPEGLLEALFAAVLDDPEFLAGEVGDDLQQ